jgi:hypothetical protein
MTVRSLPLLALFVADAALAQSVTATGACPGPITIDIQNLTPNGNFALLTGQVGGNQQVPGGPCQGTQTQLSNLALRTTGTLNNGGDRTLTPNIPGGACSLELQILDVSTCNLTAPVPMGSQCQLPNNAIPAQGPTGNMADPSFMGVAVSGIFTNQRANDFTIDQQGVLTSASADMTFSFLDANFNPLCTIVYDLSGATVDNNFSTNSGAPFVSPLTVNLNGGFSDCGRVTQAVFGSQDLRQFVQAQPWSVAFGPMQNAFAQTLENAVFNAGLDFANDFEPFVFSTYITTTGSAADEIDYTFRFDKSCDVVEVDAAGNLLGVKPPLQGQIDDFGLSQSFLVFQL